MTISDNKEYTDDVKPELGRVSLNDIHDLQKICILTFTETFGDSNSQENMSAYLGQSFSIEKLTAEISDKNSETYFALLGNKIIGYLKINSGKSQTELQDENSVELERIYILKDYIGKRAGQILLEKALEIARRKNADYIWLGVWEHNTRAKRFYKKNGFIEFDKHIFILGDDRQTDIMMKLQLKTHSVSENIIGREKSALEKWNNGDPDGFLEISADDVTYFDPFTQIRLDGKENLTKLYESIRGQIKVDKYEMINPLVQASDNMAVLTYNLISYFEGGMEEWNCTEVYRLDSDLWKIIQTHWSLTNPKIQK